MKLFNWGKTEEQKEIEKQEAFEKNLKLLDKSLFELDERIKERNLYKIAMLNKHGDLFFVTNVRLPLFDDSNNRTLKVCFNMFEEGINKYYQFDVHSNNYVIEYLSQCRDRYLILKNQLKFFGFKIIKNVDD